MGSFLGMPPCKDLLGRVARGEQRQHLQDRGGETTAAWSRDGCGGVARTVWGVP